MNRDRYGGRVNMNILAYKRRTKNMSKLTVLSVIFMWATSDSECNHVTIHQMVALGLHQLHNCVLCPRPVNSIITSGTKSLMCEDEVTHA